MAGPDIDGLTADVDATFADDGGDPTVKGHQQDHDALHGLARATPVETQPGAYTLVAADGGKVVEYDSASAGDFTVPPASSVAFPVGTQVVVRQVGPGTLSVAEGAGVTVQSRGGLTALAGQWAEAVLSCRATDEWVLTGDLA